MTLPEKVRATIGRFGMLVPGETIGVAVSGGADSVCLLHVLQQLSAEAGVRLAVLHLNHKLRGTESDGDAGFVEDLAGRLGLRFHVEERQIAEEPDNLEQAGRNARLEFFGRLRSQGVVNRVATGHTQSDQAETVLYRLLRGAGTAGLAGIHPATSDGLIRPLIECRREEVEEYLRGLGVRWREDSTNSDPTFARNRIRHRLVPLLAAEYNPAIVSTLAGAAEIARDEEEYWEREMDALAAGLFRRSREGVVIRAGELLGYHPAVRRRLVRRAMKEAKGDLRGIELGHVERVVALAGIKEGHGRLQAPGLDIMRSFEWIRVGRPREGSRSLGNYSFALSGSFSEQWELPGGGFRIYLESREQTDGYNQKQGDLDRDLLAAPLELRNWYPGDELQMPGKASQKIKFLFQEARVPIWERPSWPVITSAGVVAWTRRFGSSAAFAASSRTRRLLRVYEIEAEPPGAERADYEGVNRLVSGERRNK